MAKSDMTNKAVDYAQDVFSLNTNLSTTERAVSIAGGLALAALAAQPRPNKILSLVVLIAGAGLAIRGATGHCAVKAMAGGGQKIAPDYNG